MDGPSKEDKNRTDKIKRSTGKYCLYHSSVVREYDTKQEANEERITEFTNTRLNSEHDGLIEYHERLSRNHERLNMNREKVNTSREKVSTNHEKVSKMHEKLGTNYGNFGANHHKNHKETDTHREAVSTDFGAVSQSQSMRMLDEKRQNDKGLSSVERRVDESNLP